MAIANTTTQEFDWTSYGSTETRNNLAHMDFISDIAHNTFTDSGGSGENSLAYNNWRAINRTLAPQLDRFGSAVVGSVVRDSQGETYLAPGKNGNFQTDGMYAPPCPRNSSDVTPYGNAYNGEVFDKTQAVNSGSTIYDWMHDNVCITATYHSKNPEGIPVGTFVPLMMWRGSGRTSWTNHRPFIDETVYAFDQLDSIDAAYDRSASSKWRNGQYQYNKGHVHNSIPYIGTCKFKDSIWANKYVGRADLGSPWRDQATHTAPGSGSITLPGMPNDYFGWQQHSGLFASKILWYAHDGEGNGMMVLTFDATPYKTTFDYYGLEMAKYGHWQSHFLSTFGDARVSAYEIGGLNSGQCLWKFPTAYTDLDEYGTKDILYKMADQSRAVGTRWLVDPLQPEKNLTLPHDASSRAASHGNTDSNNFYYMPVSSYASYYHVNHKTSHIVMFPTKMGTAADAALKTPQNLYFWSGWGMYHGYSGRGFSSSETFAGHQDIKFGEMVRTNCNLDTQSFYDGVHPNSGYDSVRASSNFPQGHVLADGNHPGARTFKMPMFIASHAGDVGINRITYGKQEPGPDMRYNTDTGSYILGKTPRYIQFAGLSTSYNAISSAEYSVEAGTLINNNNAWTNPEYLMDADRDTGAICTATGFDNHLAVKLSGNPEGASVDDSEAIRQLIINIGGVKKLVLGPQQLKIALYTNNNGALGDLIAGPVVMTADGNDTDIATRQVVFEDTNMSQVPTYGMIKQAWCAFWVESP